LVGVGSVLLGTDGWRALGTFQKLGVFPPLAVCAGAVACSLIRLIVPGSRHTISPARVPAGVLSLLAVVFASIFHWRQESGFFSTGLGCLRIGLACAVPASTLLWLFLRRGVVLSPGLTGATAGGLAGLVGLSLLEIRCPNLNASHILIWHLCVTLLAMAGGLVIGRVSDLRRNRSAFLAH